MRVSALVAGTADVEPAPPPGVEARRVYAWHVRPRRGGRRRPWTRAPRADAAPGLAAASGCGGTERENAWPARENQPAPGAAGLGLRAHAPVLGECRKRRHVALTDGG